MSNSIQRRRNYSSILWNEGREERSARVFFYIHVLRAFRLSICRKICFTAIYVSKLQCLFTIVSKWRNSFGGEPLRAATTCRVWVKNPDLPAFRKHENEKKKQQKWNGEMDCNRFSGPMCPLKFHDVCAKVGRLSPTFANSSQHKPLYFDRTFVPPRKGEHAYLRELLSPPPFSLPRFDRCVHPADYPDIAAGLFWRIKGTLSRPAPQSLFFHRFF